MSDPTEQIAELELELEPGTRIGEYEVEGKVGQGGFGTVYRAVHPVIGKVVAIKVLARKFSADPEMVSRFAAEARSVNQIRHRNIIDIFLFGRLGDGRHYYVMEYLDGEPLDARIERDKRIPLADALPILRGIARALDAAHGKGVTHRDLKPENVFLVRDPDSDEVSPKLLDFGIAKLLGSEDANKHRTRTGIPIGTPFYMSPEQCRGKDVDHRTDYYAFGVVAYQMLTGSVPFDADDYMSVMMSQLADEPVPPSVANPELPVEIDAAIAALMKKHRDDRPTSLAIAQHALERASGEVPHAVTPGLHATPVPAKSSTAPSLPAAPASSELPPVKRRGVAWVIAGAVVVAAISAVIAVKLTREEPPVAPPTPTIVVTPPPVVAAPPPPPVVAAPPVVVEPPPPVKPKRALKKKSAPTKDDIIDVFGKDKP